MRTNCCHSFLAFNLKFLNFLQFFFGISIVIYSAYLLNQWQNENQSPIVPSPFPPAPISAISPKYSLSHHFNAELIQEVADQMDIPQNVAVKLVSGSDSDFSVRLYSVQLPAPWFMYFLMAFGITLCSMACIGHVAAEAINGCCLCFYILLTLIFILLEVALVAFIAIDQHWEKDIPFDPTGEIEKLRSFVGENSDVCKWVGITLLIIQAMSLLLSLVLRAMVSTQREDYNIENSYTASGDRIREPLLTLQPNQSSGLMKGEGSGTLSDIWTTQIRQKYGLKPDSSKYQSRNQNA